MTRRPTLLALLVFLTFLAFGARVLPLDTQSMWRDEIDTLCFALDFWETLRQTAPSGTTRPSRAEPSDASLPSVESSGRDAIAIPSSFSQGSLTCQPTPGLSQVDPSVGLWSTLRALLTLPGWNGPLYTIGMRPWIGLTGHSPFALRYSSLVFGLLAVPLTYVLGRRLMGTTVGLVGAALAALSPHLVWYSQEAKMYGVILALGLFAIYGLRRAIDSDRSAIGWWLLVISATTGALYCHILTALLIPLEVALGLIWWSRTRRHWRGALVVLACLTLPYLPLMAWQARNWLLPTGQATLFNVKRLNVMLEATFDGWGGNFVGEPWATVILAGLSLLVLFGLASVWTIAVGQETENGDGDHRRSSPTFGWREPLALLVWTFLPILGIWLLSARQPIFTNRYLIWAAPSFYLLASAGATTIARKGRGGTLVAGGLLLAILVGDGRALLYQSTRPIKPDFQSAAEYLEEHYQPGELIVFHLSYMVYNFDFYFSREYDDWGAPAPGSEMSETDVDYYMQTNTSGYTIVWLVLSEPTMWDPRGLVKAWMDSHALAPPEEKDFTHVSIFRYQLGE